ncbi:hypothetical protein FKM82_014873 [Ascaphus truei]
MSPSSEVFLARVARSCPLLVLNPSVLTSLVLKVPFCMEGVNCLIPLHKHYDFTLLAFQCFLLTQHIPFSHNFNKMPGFKE